MRRLFIITLLLSLALFVKAQYTATILTTTTTKNSFYIDKSLYPLNSVSLLMYADTTTVILRNTNGTVAVAAKPFTFYQRSAGVPFTNYRALLNFYDSNMVKKP